MPSPHKPNIDQEVVEDFGREWQAFDQSALSDAERADWFEKYFAVFPWETLPPDAQGFDAGCGSGRWALLAAPRVGHLHCVDPSQAIEVAQRNLGHLLNVSFHRAAVDALPFDDDSMDFGYSLGVLHHVPDTEQAIADCVRKLKPGAPLLLYLYYAFDDRPAWYRGLWRLSETGRAVVSRLPAGLKYAVSQAIAGLVYWPLARAARLAEKMGLESGGWPLAGYRRASFYTMRTDALDRFGTRLEQRFTRGEIKSMMEAANLGSITFSDGPPFHCVVGRKNQ